MAARKTGARRAGAQNVATGSVAAETGGVQPSAGSEDKPMSAAEIRKANEAADEAEAAQSENMFRLDRGEALPASSFRTATDREEKK